MVYKKLFLFAIAFILFSGCCTGVYYVSPQEGHWIILSGSSFMGASACGGGAALFFLMGGVNWLGAKIGRPKLVDRNLPPNLIMVGFFLAFGILIFTLFTAGEKDIFEKVHLLTMGVAGIVIFWLTAFYFRGVQAQLEAKPEEE